MIRTRLCFFILLLTPLVVYWQTIFSDYGFRDDYAHAREVREEPGKLVKFTASHGRPLYGALLETSFAKMEDIESLQWLRLVSVLLLTVLGLALWRQLNQSGWPEIEAAVIGLGITLLPAAQVAASWAISWPQVLALLLALAGFAAIETEIERGGLKRAIALLGGGMIYALAALIYQSNTLFAVVPLAAVLLVRSGREPASDLRWGAIHVSALLAGLLVSYLSVRLLFSNGVFHESTRMQLETNPFTKAGWFLWQPLPNALALYALRDDFSVLANVVLWVAALVTGGIIWFGYKQEVARTGVRAKTKLLLCLVVLPFLAHAVSLAAAEHSRAYRVLFALSGLVLVLLVYALRSLHTAGRIKLVVYRGALGLLVLTAVFTAHFNAHYLIAQPQSLEWQLIDGAVRRTPFTTATRVYVITPTLGDRTTERVFGDEFGSLSSDSEWAPKEMFKAALYERFPVKLPPGGSYTFASGRAVPDEKAYDLVIDMRKLKQQQER
jgi:hypothetical protein